jgi:RNA polymerase sigma-70 factor (ECF subfamily)
MVAAYGSSAKVASGSATSGTIPRLLLRTGSTMTETTWTTLRQLLADRYDDLRNQLARRLGSEDLARETLHETWLHLHRKDGTETIGSPAGYLLRTAFNIAIDRRRKAFRRARRIEIKAVLEVPDDTPGSAEVTESRQEIAALERALIELTPRRRTILLASRLEGTPLRQIADQLGISQRMVEIELKHALEHCADRLDRKVIRRFGPGVRETS